MEWSSAALAVGMVSSLVAVPLSAITLYLRAIREHQTTGSAEVAERIGNLEQSMRELSRSLTDIERDYTTKEEWLRESMYARRQLERLTEVMIKVQTELEDSRGLAAELAAATRTIVDLSARLVADRADNDAGDAGV